MHAKFAGGLVASWSASWTGLQSKRFKKITCIIQASHPAELLRSLYLLDVSIGET